ncbi:MAG: thioredoxin domain-containing protein [Planctomycetaceae bacterium]|nr:thioredoxin domain-containing protein [Planctomycetaceae bacterium]
MANRLANESSPYLLQHADNPVDWYPWSLEAHELSRADDKPIFLSIGYSACHWCHVMEHESFENEAIAEKMNELFVCVKVDREERPDLDQIYMNAVQLMTGHGGWPMSVFLTPNLQPFYGGTYWPPEPRQGMPGFEQVLIAVADAWKNRRDAAVEQAGKLTDHLCEFAAATTDATTITEDSFSAAAAKLERVFDFTYGGFGRAPKFPHPMDLQLLLRAWSRSRKDQWLGMVTLNLDKMAHGGIYDHLAGGFARYSVDQRWLVPHFEKMFYDNALLTSAYLEGFLATGNQEYAEVARETIEYILREMTDDEGGFHSTEDADSEGVEGKFYVWTPAEIREVLGQQRGERFCDVYDVTEVGNFEGQNILNLPRTIEQAARLRNWDLGELSAELADSRAKLRAVRGRRIRPGKDDKVLVSWNGLMIDALARAAGVLGAPQYYDAAARAAKFLLSDLRADNGRMLHCWRHGKARLAAYLDDYAYLTCAMVTLYEASFDEAWIDEAVALANVMLVHFADQKQGGFFFTADDHEALIARNKDLHDSSVPSGNSMAATALLRLGTLCGRADYLDAARGTLEMAHETMMNSPTATGQMLVAANLLIGPTRAIVFVGPDASSEDPSGIQQTAARFRRHFLPNCVIAGRPADAEDQYQSPHLAPLFLGKRQAGGGTTVYVCENFACQAPVHGEAGISDLLTRLTS